MASRDFASIEDGTLEATSLAQDKGGGGADSIKGSLSALQAKVAARNNSTNSAAKPPKKTLTQTQKPKQRCCVNDQDVPFCGLLPCHAFYAWLLVLGILVGLALGLALGNVVEDSARVYVFIPFWLAGIVAIPCYYRLARNYSDDDDMGCGFGDYDEGPGNIGCAITTTLLCVCILAGAGGSIAAVVATAAPAVNATAA